MLPHALRHPDPKLSAPFAKSDVYSQEMAENLRHRYTKAQRTGCCSASQVRGRQLETLRFEMSDCWTFLGAPLGSNTEQNEQREHQRELDKTGEHLNHSWPKNTRGFGSANQLEMMDFHPFPAVFSFGGKWIHNGTQHRQGWK